MVGAEKMLVRSLRKLWGEFMQGLSLAVAFGALIVVTAPSWADDGTSELGVGGLVLVAGRGWVRCGSLSSGECGGCAAPRRWLWPATALLMHRRECLSMLLVPIRPLASLLKT